MRPCLYLLCCIVIAMAIFLPIAFTQDLFNGLRGGGEPEAAPVAEKVECVLLVEEGIPEPGADLNETETYESWICFDPVNGTEYSLEGLPENFFEVNSIRSGVTTLTVTSSEEGRIVRQSPSGVSKGQNETTAPSNVTDEGSGGANGDVANLDLTLYGSGESISTSLTTRGADTNTWSSKTHGRVSLLIVRVTDGNGVEPGLSATEISDLVFGTNGDIVNLRSQYIACSGGKLEFVPAKGQNIVDGVLEVSINNAVEGVYRSTAAKWATEAIPNFLVGQVEVDFDYSMYVMPPGADFRGAAAYAAVGGRKSVYNNRNVGTVLVQMHEVGHNLGLRHSGYGRSTYGDRTCFEGAHLYERDAPVMCFNAAKSWYLGWYNEEKKQGHGLIRPMENSWAGRLTGIDEYIHNKDYSDQEYKVVLKIETNNEDEDAFPDLYVMFNRKQGVNKSVQGFGDKVNIVTQANEWGTQSWLVDTLDDDDGTDTFRQSNFDDSDLDLVVKVCGLVYEHPMPDYARVLVYLDDDKQRLDCESAFPNTPVVQWD